MTTRMNIAALLATAALAACSSNAGTPPPASYDNGMPPVLSEPQQPMTAKDVIGDADLRGGSLALPAHETPVQLHHSAWMFQVQERLKHLGYYEGQVDGVNGSKTKAAIVKFQQDKGLNVTGKVDQHTDSALGLAAGK